MPGLNDIPDCEGGQKIIFSRIPGSGEGKDSRVWNGENEIGEN
jgi:hypothetical protein